MTEPSGSAWVKSEPAQSTRFVLIEMCLSHDGQLWTRLRVSSVKTFSVQNLHLFL